MKRGSLIKTELFNLSKLLVSTISETNTSALKMKNIYDQINIETLIDCHKVLFLYEE